MREREGGNDAERERKRVGGRKMEGEGKEN